MDEQQPALVCLRGGEALGLAADVGRGEDDVSQLAGLSGREVGIAGALTLERQDVRGPVLVAPRAIELTHALVGDDGD